MRGALLVSSPLVPQPDVLSGMILSSLSPGAGHGRRRPPYPGLPVPRSSNVSPQRTYSALRGPLASSPILSVTARALSPVQPFEAYLPRPQSVVARDRAFQHPLAVAFPQTTSTPAEGVSASFVPDQHDIFFPMSIANECAPNGREIGNNITHQKEVSIHITPRARQSR